MDRIVELILRTFSLLESEGRAAKRGALDIVVVTLLWLLAAALALSGVLILLASLFLVLKLVVPAALAGALVGGLAMGLAGVLRGSGLRYFEERWNGPRES